MEADSPTPESSLKHKADALHALAAGPLASSAAKLAGCSRGIPYGKDFHFYSNFGEFKAPAREIAAKAEASLRSIAASGLLWGSKKPPPFPDDLDEACDWLVDLNDEFLERCGVSMEEFKISREKEEECGMKASIKNLAGGFQLVYGKKKKKRSSMREGEKDEGSLASGSLVGVKVAMKDKRTSATRTKVPFHIPSIRRPQDEYNILVNNKNQPFEHVWLEKSEDGSRFIHPVEKVSVLDFVDRNVRQSEPVKPLSLESTPFKLVEIVKDLKELANKLKNATEIAVDLEHNHYRSFQGLTCLMQISTRSEDFVVDTLKLRIHIGPYLREIFKDPSKRKVMHGADHDIIWLQKDFGIYVCNLFDTGQASRVLQMERNSLEYLLHHFCGAKANKEYQNADWRLRPIPDEMLKYAREDTHYLLYIYDLMRSRLLAESTDGTDLLLEVFKRSNEICLHLYEKELLTDTSYLYVYGLQEAELNSRQLAVAAGLFQWRDRVARAEDESTGYILPNKALLEIVKQLPLSSGRLRSLVKSKHPFVERNLGHVLGIIKSSIACSPAFEGIAEQLKMTQLEASRMEGTEIHNSDMVLSAEDHVVSTIAEEVLDRDSKSQLVQSVVESSASSSVAANACAGPAHPEHFTCQVSLISKMQPEEKLDRTMDKEKTSDESQDLERKVTKASVQLSNKPTAFRALFGNSSSRRRSDPFNKGVTSEQALDQTLWDESRNKVAKIKSSVALPFHYFSSTEKPLTMASDTIVSCPVPHRPNDLLELTKTEDVMMLESEKDNSHLSEEIPGTIDDAKHRQCFPQLQEQQSERMEECISASELSSGFEKCFQSINERRNPKQIQSPAREAEVNYNLKPFDYAAARNNMKFGELGEEEAEDDDNAVGSKSSKSYRDGRGISVPGRTLGGGEKGRSFQPPRRRQAFPPSGNRSTTYH